MKKEIPSNRGANVFPNKCAATYFYVKDRTIKPSNVFFAKEIGAKFFLAPTRQQNRDINASHCRTRLRQTRPVSLKKQSHKVVFLYAPHPLRVRIPSNFLYKKSTSSMWIICLGLGAEFELHMPYMREGAHPRKGGSQAKKKKPSEGRANIFSSGAQPCLFAEEEEQGSGRMFSLQKENGAKRTLLRRGSGIGIRTPTIRVRVVGATVTQFRYKLGPEMPSTSFCNPPYGRWVGS